MCMETTKTPKKKGYVMKRILRYTSLIITVAIIITTCSVVFARDKHDELPTTVNCEIKVDEDTISISGGSKATTTYTLKDTAVTFLVDSAGLVLSFPTQGGNTKDVRLGKLIKEFTVSGKLNSLAITDTLDYHYTINVDATVNDFTVGGDTKVVLSENTSVNVMDIYNEDALVYLEGGAEVRVTNKAPDSDTYLNVAIRSYKVNIVGAFYDENANVLTLPAKENGCTIYDAMKDVLLTVKQSNDNSSVPGRWSWPNLDGGATESGRYIYRFFSTDNKHKGVELIVDFIACEDKSSTEKISE